MPRLTEDKQKAKAGWPRDKKRYIARTAVPGPRIGPAVISYPRHRIAALATECRDPVYGHKASALHLVIPKEKTSATPPGSCHTCMRPWKAQTVSVLPGKEQAVLTTSGELPTSVSGIVVPFIHQQIGLFKFAASLHSSFSSSHNTN